MATGDWLMYINISCNVPLQDESDIWTYIWGSASFTPSKAYDHLIILEPGKFIQLIIGYGNQGVKNKRKFFFRLWLKDWLNTKALLKRKNMALEDYI